MDPNANLREQLKLAAVDWTGKDTNELSPEELSKLHIAHMRLCDLVESLDQWLTKGGFMTDRWRPW
jgi:hypothetical protein